MLLQRLLHCLQIHPSCTESMKNTLTHFDKDGNAHMVNVGEKTETKRIAIAQGFVTDV